jgi:hypothetical protein
LISDAAARQALDRSIRSLSGAISGFVHFKAGKISRLAPDSVHALWIHFAGSRRALASVVAASKSAWSGAVRLWFTCSFSEQFADRSGASCRAAEMKKAGQDGRRIKKPARAGFGMQGDSA